MGIMIFAAAVGSDEFTWLMALEHLRTHILEAVDHNGIFFRSQLDGN